ncbi:unnamed protein product [Clonostachys byssicola]|uniref:C2H2-type domain-containing protein n=1 Tax=Clonostachys byssicola TaxID=160290 RepID=A0A9N9XYA6_9HYPO|nr:unnamed protein product [Clonostachys byssicola]
METPVTTPLELAKKIDHHWVEHTVAAHKYSTLKSSAFASNRQAQIAAAVKDCDYHAEKGLQRQLELLDAIEDQAWLELPGDIDRVVHHQFACNDGISLTVKFRRSDVLESLKARQDAARQEAAKLAMQSSRKRQSSPTPSESESVRSCIVIQEDAETPVPETPVPESPIIAETPSPSPEDDPVATINMRWQEYLSVRQTLDEANNAAFQTASLKAQASEYAKRLKEIATDGLIQQHFLATQLRNVANPARDALDAMKLRFSGSDLPEFEAEIARFGHVDPPSVSRPKAVAKAVATSKPKVKKLKPRPANQSSIKSFFATKATPSQVVPTPPPTTKRAGKTTVIEPSPAPRRSTRLSNQTTKTVVQDAVAGSSDEWTPQPSDDDESEDNDSEDNDSEDDDSQDDDLGLTLQLEIEPESDSDGEDQAAPEPTVDEDGRPFPYPVEGGWQRVKRVRHLGHEPDVRSISRQQMAADWSRRIGTLFIKMDSKLPNHRTSTRPEAKKRIIDALVPSLIPAHDDNVKLRCDYSGIELRFTPGPAVWSLEGVYPFVLRDNEVMYHEVPNMALVANCLNLAKQRLPCTALPLASQWFDVVDAPDIPFPARKGMMDWLYNSMCNTSTMYTVLGLVDHIETKGARWEALSLEEKTQLLNILRTGSRNAAFDRLLAEAQESDDTRYKPFQVLSPKEAKAILAPPMVNWNAVYRKMQEMAINQGLSAEEFDYYCSIPSRGRRTKRVWYPFYILSRPQAIASGWNWDTVYRFINQRLDRMRNRCNKAAEKLGLGEPHVDWERFLYRIAKGYVQLVLDVKAKRPDAGMEEVAFFMLDRMGLPTVPFMKHMMGVSICQRVDHGLAMMTGITDTDEDFDPRIHINLEDSNITVDSFWTNYFMLDFPMHMVPMLREIHRRVPLHHTYWRVDPSMGNTIWGGVQDDTIEPIPPVPAFDMHLQPIDLWTNGDNAPIDSHDCAHCEDVFSSVGLLLSHCQQVHDHREWSPLPGDGNPDQAEIDDAYWDKRRTCPFCAKKLGKTQGLKGHIRQLHKDKKIWENHATRGYMYRWSM